MQIRRFSSDLTSKVPGGHPGLYAVPIQVDSGYPANQDREALAARVNGLPLLLNRPTLVVAFYFGTARRGGRAQRGPADSRTGDGGPRIRARWWPHR